MSANQKSLEKFGHDVQVATYNLVCVSEMMEALAAPDNEPHITIGMINLLRRVIDDAVDEIKALADLAQSAAVEAAA